MRIRFTPETDAYQVVPRETVRALSAPGWRLSVLRGERVRFLDRERQFLDVTLRSPDGRCAVILLIELEDRGGRELGFPGRLAEAGEEATSAVAAQIEAALSDLEKAGGELPHRFLVDGGRAADPEGASERMVPGRSPYGTLVAHLQRYRFAASVAGCPERALDIGCGAGYGLGLLGVREGFGIDISAEAVELARSMYGGMTFFRSGVEGADIGTRVDLVTAFEIVEHLPDHHALFDSAARNLKEDGRFILSVPNPRYHGTGANRFHVRDITGGHLEVMAKDRFGEVSFHHQAHDVHGDLSGRYLVREGLDPEAEFWLAVGKRARLPRRTPKASIVIPVYDKVEYTEKALLRIAENTSETGCPFEVVVVDNGSTDGTRELLSQVRGDLTVWENGENLGFAKACNQGALLARGDVVVFLNNDTEVQPGWLDALSKELDGHPETGIAGGRLLYPDGTIQHAGVAVGRDQIPFHIHRGLPSDHPLVTERRSFPVVTAACAAVRREEFYRLGMFDEEFRNGHEDIDLCLRYREQGKAAVYRPDCVVIHHESVSDGRMASRPHNLERTFRKWRHRLEQDDFRYAFPESGRACPERPLSFALKIGPPDRTHANWGDIYFAESLAKALSRKGHICRIHYLDEWGKDDLDIDVVIHLKGLSEYRPKPYNVNILWMLNHPTLHTREELSRYDAVLVASVPHATRLRKELPVPVFPLLQATDPEHFRPRADTPKEFDLVFVGNNQGADRLSMRRIVADLLPTDRSLAVWGAGWEGKLPDGVLQGPFVAWEDLPGVYARGRIVLNDHQPEMREHGFVNNRTFDAVACGAVLISDTVRGMDDVLPVLRYARRKELRRLVDDVLDGKGGKRPDPGTLRRKVLDSFTFDRRADEILDVVSGLGTARARREAARIAVPRPDAERPLVSVLMSTHDRRNYLPAAMASVRGQSYANWELVLVNDGGKKVDDLVARAGDGRIRLIDLPEHRGKGYAINRAFEASRGEFIAHLDDDDIWYPDHLERLMLPLSTIPGIRMAYSDAYNVTLREEGGVFRETKRELKYHHQVEIRDLLSHNHIQGISVVHHRDLFAEVGGMDDRLRVLIDWDLWRRLAASTYPYHVSRVTADHFLREVPSVTGDGQITALARTDPAKYRKHRYRILTKEILPAGSPLLPLLQSVRNRERRDYFVFLGERYERASKRSMARRCFRYALRQKPSDANLSTRLGLLELEGGDPAEALSHFCRSIDARPAEVANYLYAAVACLEMKRGDAALTLLSHLEGMEPLINDGIRAVVRDYRQRALSVSARTG